VADPWANPVKTSSPQKAVLRRTDHKSLRHYSHFITSLLPTTTTISAHCCAIRESSARRIYALFVSIRRPDAALARNLDASVARGQSRIKTSRDSKVAAARFKVVFICSFDRGRTNERTNSGDDRRLLGFNFIRGRRMRTRTLQSSRYTAQRART